MRKQQLLKNIKLKGIKERTRYGRGFFDFA